jgi:hypothetical protein
MKVLFFQAHVENPIELTPFMVFITTPNTHYFIIAINIRQLHGNIFFKLGRKKRHSEVEHDIFRKIPNRIRWIKISLSHML